YDDLSGGRRTGQLRFRNRDVAELLARDRVAPILERPLGELHDVALVHERDGVALRGDRVLDRLPHQALRAEFRDRLDADGRAFADLSGRAALDAVDAGDDGVRPFAAGRPLDAGVNVFRVLAEDRHVHAARLADRRRDTLEIANRTNAGVK